MQAHKRTTTAQTQPMALPQYAPVQMQNFSVMPAPGMMQAWPQPFQVAQTSYQMPMTMSMWPGVAPTMPMPFAYGMVLSLSPACRNAASAIRCISICPFWT